MEIRCFGIVIARHTEASAVLAIGLPLIALELQRGLPLSAAACHIEFER